MALMNSGGKAVKFENVGDAIKGTVTRVDEDVQAKDLQGRDTVEDRVHLTDTDGEDRTLYVNKGLLRKAIADAVRAAGKTMLEPGDTLAVLHHGTVPSRTPSYAPAKDFQAKVTPGTGQSAAVVPASATSIDDL